MSQRVFVISFIVLVLIGVLVLSYSKLTKQDSVSPVSSPGVSDTLGLTQTNPSVEAQDLSSQPQATLAATMKQYTKFPGELPLTKLKSKKAEILTDKGKIDFEIYPEATKAASNFIFLAQDHFYDGLVFHRVVPGFVIQGGDPKGDGTGGPGYRFEDEPVTRKYTKGIVAMANAGPNTNGSQFFIMLEDHPELPPNYTIFGNVISGQDVISKIKQGDVMRQVTILPLR